MPYNPYIHHRRSLRLQGYDYSQAGWYFITICSHNREFLFGDIIDGEMKLNDAGKIADECWIEIPKHFPNAILHDYVVMPNHIHGIVELTGGNNVGAEDLLPPQENIEYVPKQNAFQKMIPRSIGSIVKGFKIGVTKWFRYERVENFQPQQTVWQRNYHEHIIRNEQSYHKISEYIINNPRNWNIDKFSLLTD